MLTITRTVTTVVSLNRGAIKNILRHCPVALEYMSPVSLVFHTIVM